jgi:hypothetical protein
VQRASENSLIWLVRKICGWFLTDCGFRHSNFPVNQLRELKKLDKVAHVRFASVYRSFEDIDEFKTLVDEVRK